MFASWKGGRSAAALCLAWAAAGLLLAASVVPAGETPPGGWPWMRRPKIHGYEEKPPVTPPPTPVTQSPMRYTITITVFPPKAEVPKESTDIATVIAHLPEDAKLWFDGVPTRQRGTLREFESPPLKAGNKYSYNARVVWFEDGRWVSETRKVPVSPGATSCVYLSKLSAIAAALAKLSPEDRKLAEQQRFCPVQLQNQLGAMGVPVKVMIKGQPVFLCCEGCTEEARKNPDKTLATVKELKAKNVGTPPK